MRQHLLIGILGLGAMVAGGCRHQEPPRAAQVPHGPVEPLPAGSFARQWASALELPQGAQVKQVWLRQNLLFIRTNQNQVFQLDAEGGTLRSMLQPAPAGGVLRAPVLTKEFVVWPANSVLQVYNHAGRKVKSVSLESAISSGGAADGDRLFIGVRFESLGRILALDLEDQYTRAEWELQRSHVVSSAPAVYEHTLYAADSGGTVFAVSTDNTRNPAWGGEHTFGTYAPIVADLKVDANGLYVASTDTILYCLDRGNAKIKWQWLSGQALSQTPILTQDTVYQPLPDGRLAAIDKVSQDPQAYNRKARWIVPARQFVAADAAHAYVLGRDGHLLALDKQTGKVAFRSVRSDFAALAQNPASGLIYGATADGVVTAIRPVLKAGVMGERQ